MTAELVVLPTLDAARTAAPWRLAYARRPCDVARAGISLPPAARLRPMAVCRFSETVNLMTITCMHTIATVFADCTRFPESNTCTTDTVQLQEMRYTKVSSNLGTSTAQCYRFFFDSSFAVLECSPVCSCVASGFWAGMGTLVTMCSSLATGYVKSIGAPARQYMT